MSIKHLHKIPTGVLNNTGVVRKFSNFRQIIRYISQMMQDSTIVTIEDEQETAPELTNGTIFNDLEWPLTCWANKASMLLLQLSGTLFLLICTRHPSVEDISDLSWKPISSIKPTPASENVAYLLTYLFTWLTEIHVCALM